MNPPLQTSQQTTFSFSLQSIFEVSCIQCKQWHSKCDRILPTCTSCKKRGISCEYRAKKRRRSPNDNSSANDSPSNRSDASTTSCSPATPSTSASSPATKFSRTESQEIILNTSLKQSNSRIHLPENLSIINTNLIQHILSEHSIQQFPLLHLFKPQLLSAVSAAQQKKTDTLDPISLAFLFSSQGRACVNLKMFDQAKQYMTTSMHILSPITSLVDANNVHLEQHPVLPMIWLHWIGIASLDPVLIQRIGVLQSYLQIYVKYQKKQLLHQKNQILLSRQQASSSSNSSSRNNNNNNNNNVPPQQSVVTQTTTTTNSLGLTKEQIILQLSIMEHYCRHVHFTNIFYDDDLYYSIAIPQFLSLFLEGYTYKTFSKSVAKYFVPDSEQVILPTIVSHLQQLLDLFAQPHSQSQFIAIAMQFETLCTLLETCWFQGKYLKQPDAFVGTMICMRGLRMRFLQEIFLQQQQEEEEEQVFGKILSDLLHNAANQLIKLMSQLNPLFMMGAWYTMKRFCKQAILIHLQQNNSSTKEVLQLDLKLLEMISNDWNVYDEQFPLLMEQLQQQLQELQLVTTTTTTTTEAQTEENHSSSIEWDELDLFFKQWE